MFDPNALTFGQVSSFLKDFTIVGVLVASAWKSRGLFDKFTGFIDRVVTHMDLMEKFVKVATENHLTHIEADLRTLAGRKSDIIEVDDTLGSSNLKRN